MAPQQTSFGLILLLYGAGLGAAAQMGKIATTFPLLRTVYPASDITQGALLSLISLIGVILGIVAGQLVARLGYKPMLVFGLSLGGAMSIVQAFLPSLEVFLFSRLIEGISHLVIVVAAPTLINQATAERHHYLSMTLWSTFFGVAFASLAFLAPSAVSATGLGGFYAMHGAYMFAFAAIVFWILPRYGRADGRLPSLREILQRHVKAYRSPTEAPAALGWLCYTLTFVSILTVLPPYLPEAQRVTLSSFLPIAGIVTSFTLGTLLMRFLAAVTVVQIGFLIGAAAAIWMGLSGVSAAALVLLFVAMGLVQASSFAVIPELNKTAETQALANGALAQMGNLGTALGTPLLLSLISIAGIGIFPIALLILYVLGIGIHAYAQRVRERA